MLRVLLGLTSLCLAALLWLSEPAQVLACDGGCLPASSAGGPEPDPAPDPCDSGDCSKGGGGGCDGGYGLGGFGTGKPVSPASGKEFLTHTDLILKGVYTIRMARKYDNQTRYDSPLGYGWAFTYDKRLFKYSDGSVVVRRDCGVRDKFVFSGGTYQPDIGRRDQLVENGDGSFTLTKPNGSLESYDAQGKLAALQDTRGNRLEMTYDSRGRLPIIGSSPYSLDPNTPAVIAYDYRLIKVGERLASGTLTGRYVDINYNDTTGRVTGIQASDGRAVTYTHDITTSSTNGNLRTVNGLNGLVSSFDYQDPNDAHNLTSIQVGAGTTPYINTYDDQDRVILQTHGNHQFSFLYLVPGLDTRVTETVKSADGTTVLNTLNVRYLLSEYGYPEVTYWTLDDGTKYRRVQVRNADERVTREETYQDLPTSLETLIRAIDYDYDTAGNKIFEAVTVGVGDVVTKTWGYDHNWVQFEQTVSSLAPGKIFRTEYTFYYDGSGNPTNIKEEKRRKDGGSFQTTTYTYDTDGRLVTTTLPDGHTMTNVYTGAFLTKVYHDDGGGGESPYLKETYDYDTHGNRDEITDANNNTTTLIYDDRGRVTQITNALAEETHYTYIGDELTQIEIGRTAAAGEGLVVKLNYTPEGWLGSLERKKDVGGWRTVTSYTYDSRGKALSATDALGRTTLFEYDGLGRPTRITDPGTNATRLAYDALDNRVSVIDAKNQETRYTYDALSRLIQVEQLGITPSAVTGLSYDAAGNLTTVIDPESHTTTYQYDALSNQTAIIQPMTQAVQHIYDNRNRLDYILNARGQKIDYSYFNWGGIDTVNYYPDNVSTTSQKLIDYAYEFTGDVQSVNDNQTNLTLSYTYDAQMRQDYAYWTNLGGSNRYYTNSDYDRYGNRSDVAFGKWNGSSWTEQHRYTYTYNKEDRLTAAQLISPTPFTFSYYDTDQLQTKTHPNGLTTGYTYEVTGPVKQIQVSGTGGTLGQRDYAYDANLNVDTLQTLIGLQDYNYDGVNRLTQALYPAATGLPQEDFGYDKVGNREDITDTALYQYDNNNRITQSPGKSYSFDDDGNMLSRGGSGTFTYDHDNRLTQYQDTPNTASYAYDPFGRRISKTVDDGSTTTTTYYLWDSSVLFTELDLAGTALKKYAYLPDSFLPAQLEDVNGTYDVHSDHLDTPTQLTDSGQAVVWASTHQAFGQTTPNEDVDGNGTDVTFNLRFPGQYYDQETGLHYNYFRYYDPSTGRYLNADPIGLAGGDVNLYAYVKNDPINWIDEDALSRRRGGNPYGGYGTNQYNVPVLRNDWQNPYRNEPSPNSPLRPRTDRDLRRENEGQERDRFDREFRDRTLQQWPDSLLPPKPDDLRPDWLEPWEWVPYPDPNERRSPQECGPNWPNSSPSYR